MKRNMKDQAAQILMTASAEALLQIELGNPELACKHARDAVRFALMLNRNLA